MLFALLAALLAAPSADLRAAAPSARRTIRGEALSAHVRFLADDLLEGRGTGTRGHAIAARYVAAQLQSAGLEPAGERGSWFQAVPLRAMAVDGPGCALEVAGEGYASPGEVLFYPRGGAALDEVSAPLVFAGYGISAPYYGYDDAATDLRGKIAVILFGAPRSDRPDFFPAAASAVLSDVQVKSQLLASRGAVGVLMVVTPQTLEKVAPWSRLVDSNAFEQMVWMEGERPGGGRLLPFAALPPQAFDRLLAKAGRAGAATGLYAEAAAGRVRPFPLGIDARLRVAAKVRDLTSDNVAGLLRGADPRLSREHVVLTAHLDHLGIGPAVGGDSIYNGATDDAAGVAALLEIARAFRGLGRAPPRSILFLAVTAEEKGLQGSDYFVHHPTVPIDSIVAGVNSDFPFGRWQPRDLVVRGAEHSTLERQARAAAAALDMKLSPDPSPEMILFIRSDQYSFVKQGIPSVFPTAGWLDERGGTARNQAILEDWLHSHYHQPSDEWDPRLDWEWTAQEARAYFLLALGIGIDPQRPHWNRGDVFEKLFGSVP